MSQQTIFLKNLILTDLILFLSVPSGVIYEELFHQYIRRTMLYTECRFAEDTKYLR